MLQTKKYVFLPIVILFFCGFGFAAYKWWKEMKENAMLSCLSSVASEMNKAISLNKFKVDNQPRALTKDEVEQLLKQINAYDCGGSHLSSEEIHVAVGDVNKRSPFIKIKVWTNGSDEIAGTDDDLVIPYGEAAY